MLAKFEYVIVKEVDSRRLKIEHLLFVNEDRETRLGIFNAICSRCSDMLANLALMKADKGQVERFKLIGFMNEQSDVKRITDRHIDELRAD